MVKTINHGRYLTKMDKWTKEKYKLFLKELNTNKDLKYKEFNQKIIITEYPMLGVRTPLLRKIAKEISKTDYKSFLKLVTTNTYEEILIEGFVISNIKDVDESITYFDKFIKKIDNWAICDLVVSGMKIVKNNKKLFFNKIKNYLQDKHEYTVRVGVILLLDFYIEKDYLKEVFKLIDNIKREEYYIKMAIAWLLSICLIKYKEETLIYLKNSSLDDFTYNKALQKARESTRVTKEEKEYYNSLKRK